MTTHLLPFARSTFMTVLRMMLEIAVILLLALAPQGSVPMWIRAVEMAMLAAIGVLHWLGVSAAHAPMATRVTHAVLVLAAMLWAVRATISTPVLATTVFSLVAMVSFLVSARCDVGESDDKSHVPASDGDDAGDVADGGVGGDVVMESKTVDSRIP